MAKYTRFIKNDQWKLLEPMLPKPKRNPKGGRPPIDNREVMEGILWILRTGARWQDLPDRYPSASTCWRRLRLWEEQGVWLDVWRKFLSMLKSYFDLGGYHVQFNCVKSETLRQAQLHPEKFRDLVVRVAGFSAYFVTLDREVQEEIVKRTELMF